MFEDIFIPFLAIGLAELGDKTQLAVLCLSSRTKKYMQLLLGVALAFALADGLAILFGGFISQFIPLKYLHMISGSIFILFGILTLLSNKEEENKCELANPFLSAFTMIFLSELGDKTQIASGLFATKFSPLLVFIGVISALVVLSISAVYLGQFITKRIKRKWVSLIAGTAFIVIGLFCLLS